MIFADGPFFALRFALDSQILHLGIHDSFRLPLGYPSLSQLPDPYLISPAWWGGSSINSRFDTSFLT